MKRKLLVVLAVSALLSSATVETQTDADNFYKSERVNMEKVSFLRGEFTPEGATPVTTTRPTLSSNVKFMNFYPFSDIETISPRALLFIVGENAHSREFSEDAYCLAAEPKELLIVPGAGHVDLYDRTSLIPFERLKSFFKEYLNKLKLDV